MTRYRLRQGLSADAEAKQPISVCLGFAACYDPYMARGTNDLLHEALDLPLDERAKMAAELLESLHDAESEVDVAWAEEIRARAAAVREGELQGTDWRLVLDKIEQDILGR